MPNKELARRSTEERESDRAKRQAASDERKAERVKAREAKAAAVEEANEAIKKGRVKMPRTLICDECGKTVESVVPCLHSARLLCSPCEAEDVSENAPTPPPPLAPVPGSPEDAEDLLDG